MSEESKEQTSSEPAATEQKTVNPPGAVEGAAGSPPSEEAKEAAKREPVVIEPLMAKYTAAQRELEKYKQTAKAHGELSGSLEKARSAYQSGDFTTAMQHLLGVIGEKEPSAKLRDVYQGLTNSFLAVDNNVDEPTKRQLNSLAEEIGKLKQEKASEQEAREKWEAEMRDKRIEQTIQSIGEALDEESSNYKFLLAAHDGDKSQAAAAIWEVVRNEFEADDPREVSFEEAAQTLEKYHKQRAEKWRPFLLADETKRSGEVTKQVPTQSKGNSGPKAKPITNTDASVSSVADKQEFIPDPGKRAAHSFEVLKQLAKQRGA